MRRRNWLKRARPGLGLGAVLLLAACGESMDSKASMGAYGSDGGAGPYEPGAGAGGSGAAEMDAALPENETEKLVFSAPAVGRDHVWVTSAENDLVLRIDAVTRAVEPIEVGDAPSHVVTVPGEERGVVLNRGSDELSIVSIGEDGEATVEFLPLPRHFNALTLDPSGKYAVAWFDLTAATPGEDATALQDAIVLDLAAGKVHPVSTGFRPRAPFFSADGKTCFLVTEDGVSLVDLEHPDAAPRVLPTAPDPFHQDGREVQISPDGTYVVSRGTGEASVTILTPADEALRTVALDAEPTDLDLFADGTKALVMLRDIRRVAVVELATGLVDTIELPAALGSAAVSPQGDKALLYTTLPIDVLEPRIGVLDLRRSPPALAERPVRKEIAGAVIDPAGKTAFLLHRKAEGEPDPSGPQEEFLARSPGYSLVDLDTLFVRLVTTAAEPTGILFSADLRRGWVPLSRPEREVHAVQILDLDGLDVRTVELPSPPEVVGEVAPAERVFVTQTHPQGRISFLVRDSEAAASDALETLSGYLLNGRIE